MRHRLLAPPVDLLLDAFSVPQLPNIKRPYSYKTGQTMHDLQTARKLGVYRALYRINQSFANLVSQCAELRVLKMLSANTARRYRTFIQELQAEMNRGLANLIETAESRTQLRLIKTRKIWEAKTEIPKTRGIKAPVRLKKAVTR